MCMMQLKASLCLLHCSSTLLSHVYPNHRHAKYLEKAVLDFCERYGGRWNANMRKVMFYHLGFLRQAYIGCELLLGAFLWNSSQTASMRVGFFPPITVSTLMARVQCIGSLGRSRKLNTRSCRQPSFRCLAHHFYCPSLRHEFETIVSVLQASYPSSCGEV